MSTTRNSGRRGFPARVQQVVRQRADYRCEACGTWLIGRSGGVCVPAAGGDASTITAEMRSDPASAVLLCAPCAARR